MSPAGAEKGRKDSPVLWVLGVQHVPRGLATCHGATLTSLCLVLCEHDTLHLQALCISYLVASLLTPAQALPWPLVGEATRCRGQARLSPGLQQLAGARVHIAFGDPDAVLADDLLAGGLWGHIT